MMDDEQNSSLPEGVDDNLFEDIEKDNIAQPDEDVGNQQEAEPLMVPEIDNDQNHHEVQIETGNQDAHIMHTSSQNRLQSNSTILEGGHLSLNTISVGGSALDLDTIQHRRPGSERANQPPDQLQGSQGSS